MGIFDKLKALFTKSQDIDAIPAAPSDQEPYANQSVTKDPVKPQQSSTQAAQPIKMQGTVKPIKVAPLPISAPHAVVQSDKKPTENVQVEVSQSRSTEKTVQPAALNDKPGKQKQDSTKLPNGIRVSGNYMYYVKKKEKTATILKYIGNNGEKNIIIPADLDGYTVDRIGKAAFSAYKVERFSHIDIRTPQEKYAIDVACSFAGTTVHFPECIDSIDNYAFYGAVSLQKVILPPKMISIGNYAFYGCANLKSISFPKELSVLGYHSFEGCSKLKDIFLPCDLKKIQVYTFKGCSSLHTIRFPDQLETLEYDVFDGCICLQSVRIPATLKSIYGRVFVGCSNLNNIEILGSDDESLFYSLDGIIYSKNKRLALYPEGKTDPTFELPEGVTGVDDWGFAYNTHIKEIKLPKTLKIIRPRAFTGCTNLEKLELPFRKVLPDNDYDVFEGCDKLTLYIPQGSANERYVISVNKILMSKGKRTINYALINKDSGISYPDRVHSVEPEKPVILTNESLQSDKVITSEIAIYSTFAISDKLNSLENAGSVITKDTLQAEEGRRVVVDFAFSMSIPNHYEYSLTPPDFVSGIIRHENVLVAVRRGSDIQEYHEAPDIIAVEPLMRAGRISYTDIKSAEGQEYIDNILRKMTHNGQWEWETLVDREDLLIGFHEKSYFAKMFFNAGVFCNKGMYDFTFAFDHGTKAENAQKVRDILLSIQPVEAKRGTIAKKASGKKSTSPGKGRVLVDKNWTIAIPEGFKRSALSKASNGKVLEMVPIDQSMFDSDENISATRLPLALDSGDSLHDSSGRAKVDSATNIIATMATSAWEVIIKRENLIVGYCESTLHGIHRFIAGVFTNQGMYMMQLFISDKSKFRRDERAREILLTIRSIDDPEEYDEPDNSTLPESTSDTTKTTKLTNEPKTRLISKAETVESLRRKIPKVKPKHSDEYYDFTVKRATQNWLSNTILGAIEKTGFISYTDNSADYELSSLDHASISEIFEKQERPCLPIADDANRFLEVLFDNSLGIDQQSKLYSFPHQRKIAKIEMLEAFQSFAWCVQSYATDSNQSLDDIPIDTLLSICKLIQRREYVCYTSDSYSPQLCKILAYGNFFTEMSVDLLKTTNTMSAFELKEEKHGSLLGLQEELTSLLEPIQKIHQHLLDLKQNGEEMENMLQVVLSVWCTFCLEAHEDFQLIQPVTEEKPKEPKEPTISTEEIELVGTRHDGRVSANEVLSVGDTVSLERNPENPYDSNAIEVFNEYGQSIGHIPAHISGSWARPIDKGRMRILNAEVVKAIPLSQRSSRAKNPITVIEVTYERD